MSNQWADQILICDGGSEDDTVSIAKKMPKTTVIEFLDRVWSKDKRYWRNPHGKQINYIQDYAFNELEADWIIFDDCDSFPSLDLQESAREFFLEAEANDQQAIYAYHIYIYKDSHYFPDMNNAGTAIWAWRKNSEIRACEENPWSHLILRPTEINHISYGYPFSNLHFFMPTDEKTKAKLDFYRESGQHSHLPTFDAFDPEKAYGKMKELETWMRFR